MSAFSSALPLTLHVAAARADATPRQVAELRRRVVPVLREEYVRTGDEASVRVAVATVMGDGWRPSSHWAAQIAAMTGSDRQEETA